MSKWNMIRHCRRQRNNFSETRSGTIFIAAPLQRFHAFFIRFDSTVDRVREHFET
jgi:hypothetical protein